MNLLHIFPRVYLRQKPIQKLIFICLICLWAIFASASPHLIAAINSPTITINIRPQGKLITNKFAGVNAWYYLTHWDSTAVNQPANYFATNYPYVKYVSLYTATGGCSLDAGKAQPQGCDGTRDLLKDANNPNQGFNFDPLDRAIRNVLKQGLKPIIKTGNIPCVYSRDCQAGKFALNTRLPSDWQGYYKYIYDIARHMVDTYGMQEVKTWRWGMGSEINNPDWFTDGKGNTTTKQAVFKLYDYTVAALQAALGRSNLIVGSHIAPELGWNGLEFIDHCGKGKNYYSGKRGTQLNFLGFSAYQGGNSGKNAGILRRRAEVNGLKNLKLQIDEGIDILGSDGKQTSGDLGSTYSASAYAMVFKNMLDYNIDFWSRWNTSSNGFWDGVHSVGSNVAMLTNQMTGDRQLPVQVRGKTSQNNIINAVAGYNPKKRTLHVLAFNHNPNVKATSREKPTISMRGLPVRGKNITVKQWLIDDKNAQYWWQWQQDAAKQGIGDSAYARFSKDSSAVQEALSDTNARNFFTSRVPKYRQLAALKSTQSQVKMSGNTIRLSPNLEHHAVVLYEIGNI
ncbi:GH39 family glycosyl hydrolase [Calothrix sp. UHCC 0171]|uniref:GH39 family glycosyl hydrolase n=1 Tax=Calothrix sp. UHCC 0171 TaxID=3110245 RepID=UPI002B1EB344|nr:hypothetical protein [Calothrix sp. UHCC 0171]MEA5572391.1 hypothetical protein [Calothrix sp. UHCC 0171]